MNRCSWCSDDELYQKYHDCEWGIPVYDDLKLFEMLILEGAQAGLSWITILKKRENYREALDGFDFEKIALYGESDIERLMLNEGLIRNKLKINSIIKNAQAFIEVRNEFGTFSDYLWNFVDGKIIICDGDLGSSELSDLISKDLKKRGFNFVGTKIIYAFLQAVGVICGHEPECSFRSQAI